MSHQGATNEHPQLCCEKLLAVEWHHVAQQAKLSFEMPASCIEFLGAGILPLLPIQFPAAWKQQILIQVLVELPSKWEIWIVSWLQPGLTLRVAGI